MKINERKIKIIGICNIPQDLENGNNYHITIKNAEVRGISDDPNDDGTIDRTFKLKISEMSEVNILTGFGKYITAKPKGSQSKAMRAALYRLYDAKYQTNESFIDFEDFYQKRMSELIDAINQESEL